MYRRTLAALLLSLASLGASAQSFRAYLSIDGNDANPCTLAAPCRLLPAAIAVVAPGGEIWMLDSANYNTGTVNVNKSVTILAVPGALGSVVALGGNAIEITTTSVNVALRNLNIVPYPGNSAATGVLVNGTTTSVLVQNCNVSGFTGGFGVRSIGGGRTTAVVDSVFRNVETGVRFEEGASGTVSGSHFSDTYSAVHVLSTTPGQTSKASVNRSTATHGAYGFTAEAYNSATASTQIAVIDSTVDFMTVYGVYAYAQNGATSLASISGTQVSHSNVAVAAVNAGARTYASNNQVTQNSYGFLNSGGAFNSAVNNGVIDNTNNTTGIISTAAGV